jgi:hypothetical protein
MFGGLDLKDLGVLARLAALERMHVQGPKRRPKRLCCSGVMCWSRKMTTRLSSHAWRISSNCWSDSSVDRSTPQISAPIVWVSGLTVMVS